MALQALYRVQQLPVFQNRVFGSAAEARACAKGDIDLVRDSATGLIFNRSFSPELMTYDADYQNEQAVSPAFRQHLDHVANIVRRHLGERRLIEVGCGKGYFLEHLQAAGFDITGLDPAYEGSNPSIVKACFTPATGLRAEGIVLRHVLEHVADPVRFLTDIRASNGGGGTLYVEVPCFDWICARRAWFDVFYEHVNYFRAGDFARMFGTLSDTGHVFGGQYLYVVADLATLRPPRLDASDGFTFPSGFLAGIERSALRIRAQRTAGRGNRAIVWGGSSKGVVFSLLMERAGAPIDFVVDINPAKQGRFLPATGLPVLSPAEALARAEPGADIYVMNGNYLSEIRQATFDRFNYLAVDHEDIRTRS